MVNLSSFYVSFDIKVYHVGYFLEHQILYQNFQGPTILWKIADLLIIEKILLEKRNRESCVEIPEKNGQSVNLNGYSEIEIETNQEIESSINQNSIDNGGHPEVGQKDC